jgi:hypothetical protein
MAVLSIVLFVVSIPLTLASLERDLKARQHRGDPENFYTVDSYLLIVAMLGCLYFAAQRDVAATLGLLVLNVVISSVLYIWVIPWCLRRRDDKSQPTT